jgi:hypothetical protein
MVNQVNPENKIFSWQDKSGRGETSIISLSNILDEKNREDWFDNLLHEWADEAYLGDEWEDTTEKYICIAVNN